MKSRFPAALLSLDTARLGYFRDPSPILLMISHESFLVVTE